MVYRYSMINTASFCPTKFKLSYIELLKEYETEPSHFIFGTSIHSAIQAHFEGEDAVEVFEFFWATIKEELYTWERYKYAELKEIGITLLTKWVKTHAKNYRPLHVEKEISFKLNGFDMTGKPDFIGYYKDKLSVVDWKTSNSQFDKRKGQVDGQTWIYVHGAKQAHNLNIEQVVYAPLVKYGATVQNPIVIPVTENKLTSMLDNATLVMRDLSTRTEWSRNEGNCLRCGFYEKCYSK